MGKRIYSQNQQTSYVVCLDPIPSNNSQNQPKKRERERIKRIWPRKPKTQDPKAHQTSH
jgi:hypothetical protein